MPFPATSYEIRYTNNVTDFSDLDLWYNLTSITDEDVVSGSLEPLEAGEVVTFSVPKDLFLEHDVYYLSMRALDENNQVRNL